MTRYKVLCIFEHRGVSVYARLIGDAIHVEATRGELLHGLSTLHHSFKTVKELMSEAMDKEMRKRVDELLGGPAKPMGDEAAHDPILEEEAPCLHAMMTVMKLPGGGKRTPASLTIFTEDGQFKACLNDKHNGRSFFISAIGLDEVLAALERTLASGQVPWRRAAWQQGKGGGRK